jgi:SH3-like domain-containing protein
MGGSEKGVRGRDDAVAGPTKTGFAGQASENWGRRALTLAALVGAALSLAGCEGRVGEGKDCPPTASAATVSGFCVPRYVSLKRDKVYARKGPGTDYPALWIYRAKGLPVQVVAETLDWRRICDPDGGAVWVHRSMVDGRRTVQALGPTPVELLEAPRIGARITGLVNPRALAALDRCRNGWCRLTVDGAAGWALASRVWGVASAPQCR